VCRTIELASNDRLYQLIQALQAKARFDHPVERFELLKTHISYVLLTGPYAYKFKKPIDLGFLDFGTLAKRKFYCEEELRLNRRLAPTLYLEMVPITGSELTPVLGGTGSPIEYCIKMVQFPQDAQLDRVLKRGELSRRHIDELATQIASFHERIALAGADTPFGTPAQIRRYALENFDETSPLLGEAHAMESQDELRAWTIKNLDRLDGFFRERKQRGWVRECHGDMHLTNMVLLDKQVVIFDCIEFNEFLYWIDVISEIAFLLMDLDYRDRPDLAHRFLNRYLEQTGDYAGLALLDFYRVYRTLVRAKVADIQCRQLAASTTGRQAPLQRYLHHVELARRYTNKRKSTPLVITHGLSGSGKTWLTSRLVELAGAIRIRSDVERKRLQGLITPNARTGSHVGEDLYQPGMTERTYERLLALAREVLTSGFPAIVDATFLKRSHRDAFRQLATRFDVPYRILDLKASAPTLRDRIMRRQIEKEDASEATLAVLDYQLGSREPLTPDEAAFTVTVDTETDVNMSGIADQIIK
jgi:Uncharacterized protein conserved in bacteria